MSLNLFDLAAKISLDTHDYETGIKAARSMMQQTADVFGSGAEKIGFATGKVIDLGALAADTVGSVAKAGGAAAMELVQIGETAAAVVGTAATATATAVGGLIKTAVGEFSDYEQLTGGVETLFKESADAVMAYADGAYKTAGMPANDYMETVTSFSASLLQGLAYDTAKATEFANLAITDMSDNANKMGTDISMIQYAYQGFAKQNYTINIMSAA